MKDYEKQYYLGTKAITRTYRNNLERRISLFVNKIKRTLRLRFNAKLINYLWQNGADVEILGWGSDAIVCYVQYDHKPTIHKLHMSLVADVNRVYLRA